MYATPNEMLAAFRSQSRDTVQPYLWSDAEVYQYMTQGEAMVAGKLLCIPDMTSAAAVIDFSSGDPEIAMHHSLIRVRSAFVVSAGQQSSLELRTMDAMRGAKIFVDTGRPNTLILGGDVSTARLYPIPSEDGTLQLTVFRNPLAALTASSTKFEVPYQYTDAVYQWVLHRAYNKTDAEAFDPAMAQSSLSSFEYLISRYATSESQKNGGLKDGVVVYGGI